MVHDIRDITHLSRMNNNRSLAKTPSEDKQENPNRDRIKRNSPSRFLLISTLAYNTTQNDVLETGNIVRDTIE